MADEVKVSVRVDDSQAIQAFVNLERRTTSFTRSFAEGIGLSGRAFDVFQGNIAANIAVAAFTAITDSAKFLFDAIAVEGVNSAIEFEQEVQAMEVALRNTGVFTKKLSQDLQDLAQQTQETTKFSDGMVISAATQLQTLARLSGEGLQRATRDSTDLAAALGIDLTTAAELVAKAHEGQTGALRRYGITINDSIPASQKYAELLKIIEDRFSGTAQAQAQTYAGRIEILKNQFDDTIKQFGLFITKNEGVNAVIKVGTDILKDFTLSLTGGKTASDALTQSLVAIATIISPLAQLADGFGRVFTSAFRIGVTVVDSLAYAVNMLFSGILAGVDITYRALALAMPEAFGEASKSVTKFSNEFYAQTQLLGKQATEAAKGIFTAFSEDTALEKFAARSRKAAQDIQAAIAAQSARPAVVDQGGNGAGAVNNDIQKEIDEERIRQAEINKVIAEARIERELGETQFRIATGDARTQDILDLQNYEKQKIDETLKAELIKASAQDTAAKQNQARQKAYADAELATIKLKNKSKIELDRKELADQETFLNTAATLSSAKNKELAAIGKAAAITQIAIKTPPAVASSFEFGTKLGGPPLGFAFGAIAATAMAAQAANIAGVKFEQGGVVPGLNQFGDNVMVRANPGEVILNNTQQQELLNIANGRGASSSGSELIASVVEAVRNIKLSVEIEGREIARTIRDQRAAGFAV